jgi:plastocyanin
VRSMLLLVAFVGSTESFLVLSPKVQTVHTVTLKGNSTSGRYRFEPDEISAFPGDILLFTAGSGHPHSIAFQVEGLSEQAHAALNDAMPDRVGDLRGPLLTPGHSEYRVTVPALKPGNYYFYCLIHLSYKEQGQLIVLAPKGKK